VRPRRRLPRLRRGRTDLARHRDDSGLRLPLRSESRGFERRARFDVGRHSHQRGTLPASPARILQGTKTPARLHRVRSALLAAGSRSARLWSAPRASVRLTTPPGVVWAAPTAFPLYRLDPLGSGGHQVTERFRSAGASPIRSAGLREASRFRNDCGSTADSAAASAAPRSVQPGLPGAPSSSWPAVLLGHGSARPALGGIEAGCHRPGAGGGLLPAVRSNDAGRGRWPAAAGIPKRRLVRRQPAGVPGREHRRAGRQRHGQRSGHEWAPSRSRSPWPTVIEEGLPIEDLRRVTRVRSARAAIRAGLRIVTPANEGSWPGERRTALRSTRRHRAGWRQGDGWGGPRGPAGDAVILSGPIGPARHRHHERFARASTSSGDRGRIPATQRAVAAIVQRARMCECFGTQRAAAWPRL